MARQKVLSKKKEIDIGNVTICDATKQMLEKAGKDGVRPHLTGLPPWERVPNSACCKHCAMGPCRLNAKDPIKLEEVADSREMEAAYQHA